MNLSNVLSGGSNLWRKFLEIGNCLVSVGVVIVYSLTSACYTFDFAR